MFFILKVSFCLFIWGPGGILKQKKVKNLVTLSLKSSVADPGRFDADPDPTFQADADPDPKLV